MKMMRAAIGTNKCRPLRLSLTQLSTVAGLATTLGSGAMTNSISEVVDADVILVCGSNTTETHPVIGAQIRQAVNRGAKLIVADPREIPLAEEAEVFLPIRPGTNVALLNGMMNVIINEGLLDKEYVENRTRALRFGRSSRSILRTRWDDRGIDPEDLKKAPAATAERNPFSMPWESHSIPRERRGSWTQPISPALRQG